MTAKEIFEAKEKIQLKKEKNFEKLRTSNFKNILEKLQEKDNARLAIIEQYKTSVKNQE
jgi:hypothetical protein